MTAPTRRRATAGPGGSVRLPPGRGRAGRGRGAGARPRRPLSARPGRRTLFGWASRRVVAAAVLVAATFAGFLVLSSGLLAVTRVQVVGTSRLSVAEVLTAARVPSGTPMARLPVADIRRRVGRLSMVAGADGVTISRQWPHTVVITVRERVAVAALARPDGRWQLVDGTGQPFHSQPSAPVGLPQLQVASPGVTDPATRAALAVVVDLPGSLRALVGSVSAPTAQTVTLNLTAGRTVMWGGPGSRQEAGVKSAAVEALLDRSQKTIDVSSVGIVVTH